MGPGQGLHIFWVLWDGMHFGTPRVHKIHTLHFYILEGWKCHENDANKDRKISQAWLSFS